MSDPGKAVFLSYASQDAEAAKRICDALRQAGVEVWFDAEGGLEHGDEWDAKIRRQIKECVLFIAIISANTQAREEGYFRIEWELAAQRALGIASGVAFILPVVIDDTREPEALVPDRFRSVQWTRLRDGVASPEVIARFLKLWSHRAGVMKHQTAERGTGSPFAVSQESNSGKPSLTSGKAGFEDPALQAKPGWKVFAGLAAGVCALVAAVGWWMLRSPSPVATAPANPAPPPSVSAIPSPGSVHSAADRSESRQLVAKARALFEDLESTRDDFKFAEELLTQAKAAAGSDAEVWAAAAQLDELYNQRGWDVSDLRRESARTATQRALRLDPASFEARLAQAGLLAYTGSEGTEKEKLLRDLLRERPADHRVLRWLGSTLERLGRTDEGIVFMDQAAALPGGDPLALYNKSLGYWFVGRTVEAEEAIRAALAQRPFTSALLVSAWYAMILHGDLDGAKATLDRVPPTVLQEDRGCFFAFYLHYLRREPDAALARLAALPRDWINDNWYRGPKARLAGDALQLAGRPEAAAAARRGALKLVEERLAADPTNTTLLGNRTHLLAALGERAEAEKQFAVLLQLRGLDLSGEKPAPAGIGEICIELGKKQEAIRMLSIGLKQERHAVDYTAALLRIDPTYDPLRGEPEFARIIAEAEAVEQVNAPARVWPKDPQLKRAIELLESPEAIASDVALAEDLVKEVLAARPTDRAATVAMGRVQVYYLLRGFDRSEDRFVVAKRYAERSLALAPDDPEAMLVMATYLFRRNVELPHAAKLLRAALALRPQEPVYYRMLTNVLADTPQVTDAEVIAAAKATAERFPGDALVQYELARHYRNAGMLEEAERCLDVAIKLGPVANAIIGRARLMLSAHGDPDGMKKLLDQLPERYRGTDRAVFSQFAYALATGQPELGLTALQALPEPWMIDFDYTGPTALLAGELLLQQGKAELARLKFFEALPELGRNKGDVSRFFSTDWLETWLLMRLGRLEEARKRNEIYFPELHRPYQVFLGTTWWFSPLVQNLLLGERAKALALMREAAGSLQGRTILRNSLRLDPRMAPFRDDPEIQALLAEPPSAAKAAEDREGKK